MFFLKLALFLPKIFWIYRPKLNQPQHCLLLKLQETSLCLYKRRGTIPDRFSDLCLFGDLKFVCFHYVQAHYLVANENSLPYQMSDKIIHFPLNCNRLQLQLPPACSISSQASSISLLNRITDMGIESLFSNISTAIRMF